jgi:hypothetical protein
LECNSAGWKASTFPDHLPDAAVPLAGAAVKKIPVMLADHFLSLHAEESFTRLIHTYNP